MTCTKQPMPHQLQSVLPGKLTDASLAQAGLSGIGKLKQARGASALCVLSLPIGAQMFDRNQHVQPIADHYMVVAVESMLRIELANIQ
jgi:hypothetical protein